MRICIIISAACGFLTFACGCVTESVIVLNQTAPYAELMHSRYRLVEDCYIVSFTDSSRKDVYLTPGTVSYYRFPVPVTAEHIGEVVEKQKIMAVLPKGTVLEVIDIRRTRSVDYDHVHYFVRTVDDAVVPWNRLNAYRLMDSSKHPPGFKTQYMLTTG
jgi:hypothetical protein